MSGAEVRTMIKSSGVFLWEVARGWGVTDATFSRRLRRDFSDEEVSLLKDVIEEIKSFKNEEYEGD